MCIFYFVQLAAVFLTKAGATSRPPLNQQKKPIWAYHALGQSQANKRHQTTKSAKIIHQSANATYGYQSSTLVMEFNHQQSNVRVEPM